MFKSSLESSSLYNEKYENLYLYSHQLYHTYGIQHKDFHIDKFLENKN